MRSVVRGVDPRSAERKLSGFLLRGLQEVLEGLDGASLGHDQRVRRVVEPVRGRDVLGLVLHLSLEGREHDVRQVDAHDVQAVAGQGVHLVPHDGAAHPRLVLDDGFDSGAFLLQHELLVPRRDVGFASGRKRLPVHQVLLRAGLRERRGGRGESEYGEQSLHGWIVLSNCREVYPKAPPVRSAIRRPALRAEVGCARRGRRPRARAARSCRGARAPRARRWRGPGPRRPCRCARPRGA